MSPHQSTNSARRWLTYLIWAYLLLGLGGLRLRHVVDGPQNASNSQGNTRGWNQRYFETVIIQLGETPLWCWGLFIRSSLPERTAYWFVAAMWYTGVLLWGFFRPWANLVVGGVMMPVTWSLFVYVAGMRNIAKASPADPEAGPTQDLYKDIVDEKVQNAASEDKKQTRQGETEGGDAADPADLHEQVVANEAADRSVSSSDSDATVKI